MTYRIYLILFTNYLICPMAMYIRHFSNLHKFKLVVYSYRLELMRHIYNAESPPTIVDGTSLLVSGNHESSANSGGGSNSQLLQCITDCANASRLSLINLLPSRFAITNIFNVLILFLRCYFSHFSRTILFDFIILLVYSFKFSFDNS